MRREVFGSSIADKNLNIYVIRQISPENHTSNVYGRKVEVEEIIIVDRGGFSPGNRELILELKRSKKEEISGLK